MPECTLIVETEIPHAATFRKLVASALSACAALCPDELADVSIKLTGDKEIAALNHQFRGMNKPTNVLSFPSNDMNYLGDIAISLETVKREAKAQKKTFEAHLTHMVVHGMLHLLGYDHEDEHDAEDMEALEVKILRRVKVENPYQ